MNINTSSWHYRFNVWRTTEWKTKRKNSLCSYFWFTVYNLFVVVFLLSLTLITLWIGGDFSNDGMIKWFSIDCLSFPYYSGYLVTLLYGMIFWIVVIGCAAGIAFCAVGVTEIYHSIENRLNSSSNKKNPDGLFLSWVKAKKRKICPLIDFVEK